MISLSKRLEAVEKKQQEEIKKTVKEAEEKAKIYSIDQGPNRRQEQREQEEKMKKWWEDMKRKEDEKRKEEEEERKIQEEKSSWARDLDKGMKEDGEKVKGRVDKEERKEKKDTTEEEKVKVRKPNYIGESEESGSFHTEEDWSWSESDGNWQGVINRGEKNKERKKLMKKKKRKKETETARKAYNMIGISPIEKKVIDENYKKVKDYNEAKRMAVREYLVEVLDFDREEALNIDITDTQMSRKDDNVMYIAVEDHDIITDIHRKIAECRKPEIFARNFIPPQFFAQFCALNNLCKDWRVEDAKLKTQIRFSKVGLDILTKEKGTNKPFRISKLSAEEKATIPKFDHTLSWNRRKDRPNRMETQNVQPRGSTDYRRPSSLNHPSKRQKTSQYNSRDGEKEDNGMENEGGAPNEMDTGDVEIEEEL